MRFSMTNFKNILMSSLSAWINISVGVFTVNTHNCVIHPHLGPFLLLLTRLCLSRHLQTIIIFQGGGCKRFVLTDPHPVPHHHPSARCPAVLCGCWGQAGPFLCLSLALSAPWCHPTCLSVRALTGTWVWEGKAFRMGRGGGGSRRGWGLGGSFFRGRVWGFGMSGLRGQQVDLSIEWLCVFLGGGGS